MEDYNLVLRELINKDISNISIPENLKSDFEKTADSYLEKDQIFEAIKVFAITKNIEKLRKTGEICISKNLLEYAMKSFYFADDKGGLTKTGMEFIKQGEIKRALNSFVLAENKEMIDFITKNFQ